MRFHVLGTLEVKGVALRGDRPRALLAALLVHAGRPVSTDRLVDALWGELPPADPAAALQTTVSRLRRALGDQSIATEPGGYRLAAIPDDVDAGRAEALLSDALARSEAGDLVGALGRVEAALALVRGPAYVEFADRDFARPEATRLDELVTFAREERAELLLTLGRVPDALADAEALARAEPMRERPRALLMRALYAAGRQHDALRAFDEYRRELADELGLEPSPALRELEHEILDHALPLPVAPVTSAPGPAPVGPPKLHLPVTSFVGRDEALRDLVELVGRARLVTLTGPAGVGKSRLALHAAARLAGDRPDGAILVELGAIDDPASVAIAVASTLGIEVTGAAALEQRVVEHLYARRALLVLDNCEHVLDTAALLAERVVQQTPDVSVLATSRERLGADGEHVLAVEPLPLPRDDDGPAVALFVDRARATRPDLDIDDAADAIRAICRRLDGLPLAIELAAARAATLDVRRIADGLDERFRLLTSGRRTAAERHRSLRAAFDWSYSLLDPVEQRALAQLAVFASGFDLDASEAVLDLGGADPTGTVLALADKSLVVRRPGDDRFALLESVRAYAEQRLEERCEASATRDRHGAWAVELAEQVARRLATADGVRWSEVGRRALPEWGAAHRWFVSQADVERAMRLSGALFALVVLNNVPSRVSGWAEEALALEGAAEHPLHAAVCGVAGIGSWRSGDLGAARRYGELALEGLAPDDPRCRYGLELVADTSLMEGRLDEAIASYSGDVDAARAAGDLVQLEIALGSLAVTLSYAGRLDDAMAVADEAMAVAEQIGSPGARAWAHYARGEVRLEPDPDRALEELHQALDLATESGSHFVAGVAGLSAASLHARHGDPLVAAAGYRDVLREWERVGSRTQLWITMRSVIELLVRLGCDEPAAQLLGALRAAPDAPPAFGEDARRLDASETGLAERLGDGLDAALARGGALDTPAALAIALDALGAVAADVAAG